MDGKWSVENAREHLDEVVRNARESGPQVLTDHGEDTAVVLSCEEYARLRGSAARTGRRERTGRDFIASWRSSPLLGLELEALRDREPPISAAGSVRVDVPAGYVGNFGGAETNS